MIKKIKDVYEVNGKMVPLEEAVKYALEHPEVYQVYQLNGDIVIRTAKGGYDLDKK